MEKKPSVLWPTLITLPNVAATIALFFSSVSKFSDGLLLVIR
jgi:hypothetical protein